MKYCLSVLLLFICLGFSACEKYLDKKSDVTLTVPATLDDFQKLLDNPVFVQSAPQIGDLGSDDYYLVSPTDQAWDKIPRNSHTWKADVFEGEDVKEWDNLYKIIYTCNVVLDGLDDFKENAGEQTKKMTIRGNALFLRAFEHFYLEETFGQPYKPQTATTDLGIPLKISARVEGTTERASTKGVYDQIIGDLLEAKNYLPPLTSARIRPSRAAAFALLARCYLVRQDYANALLYADSSLNISGTLKDYNDPDIGTNNNPFSVFVAPNDLNEVLYPSYQTAYGSFLRQTTTLIDTNLYKSYANDDLRRNIYFIKTGSTYSIKGGYSGVAASIFGGLAVDEMYLTRAECYARLNDKDKALADLNKLMKLRWNKNVTYPIIAATDADDALRKVLTERRKELVFRSLRWIDLRRLNQDARFAVTLKRILNGQTYTLEPNDNRYAYPIPAKEIRLSGMPQNRR